MRVLTWVVPLLAGAGFLSFLIVLLNVRRLAANDKRRAKSSGFPFFACYGEAVVGRMHAKSPFAHLTATPQVLRLAVHMHDYEFPRTSIQRLGRGPGWWPGIAIHHDIPGRPSSVFFLPRDVKAVRKELESLGYVFEQ